MSRVGTDKGERRSADSSPIHRRTGWLGSLDGDDDDDDDGVDDDEDDAVDDDDDNDGHYNYDGGLDDGIEL